MELSHESNKRDVGKTFEVLVEGYSKRSRDHFCGRTSQNKMVVFPKAGRKIGDFVQKSFMNQRFLYQNRG